MRCLALLVLAFVGLAWAAQPRRNSGQFTAPGCGPNSRLDTCSDGCVPTCNDMDGKQCDPSPKCISECICYRGYVKSPDGYGCIEPSECF